MNQAATSDAGSAIAGWLIKITLILCVLGVIAMDGISVGSTWFEIDDAANSAAAAAATAAHNGGSRAMVVQAAQGSLSANSTDYVLIPGSLFIGRDGSVTLTVSRTAQTLVVHRIKPLAKYGAFTVTASQKP